MDNKKIDYDKLFNFSKLDMKFANALYFKCSIAKDNEEGSSLLEDIGFYSDDGIKSEEEIIKEIGVVIKRYKKYFYPKNCDDKNKNYYIGFNIEPYFGNICNKENLIDLFIILMTNIRRYYSNDSSKNGYNVKQSFFNNLNKKSLGMKIYGMYCFQYIVFLLVTFGVIIL